MALPLLKATLFPRLAGGIARVPRSLLLGYRECRRARSGSCCLRSCEGPVLPEEHRFSLSHFLLAALMRVRCSTCFASSPARCQGRVVHLWFGTVPRERHSFCASRSRRAFCERGFFETSHRQRLASRSGVRCTRPVITWRPYRAAITAASAALFITTRVPPERSSSIVLMGSFRLEQEAKT